MWSMRILLLLLVVSAASPLRADEPSSAPRARLTPVKPSEAAIHGYVGQRIDRNLQGILLHRDEKMLLDPFRHRQNASQAWAGEHVGKWLSAASMMYAYSHDPAILAKLRRVSAELIAMQLDDGYLGTYVEKDRWTSWDVWVHKYNLLGLGAYYDATGDASALAACRKIGDLMIATFGSTASSPPSAPERKDILAAGEHQGMASASILEPMLWLYRRTSDRKYLEFSQYIVASLETANGPRIVSTLLKEKTVRRVSDAKGYEMLSCVIGLLEMYRINGDPKILEAAKIACDDIVTNLSYITGGATYGENFCAPGILPNAGHAAETCVTMSLVQLFSELLQLTGEAKYGNAAEHLMFNHLLACQNPSGEKICYYTPLWGRKFYMDIAGCCISSGLRTIAMIPSLYYLLGQEKVVVNLLGASELNTHLPDGQAVRIVQTTEYPFSDQARLEVWAPPSGCTVAVRIPSVAHNPKAKIDGRISEIELRPGHFAEWNVSAGQHTIDLDLGLGWQIIRGSLANEGLFALQYGPLVYAYDSGRNDKAHAPDQFVFDMDLSKLSPALSPQSDDRVAQVNGHLQSADRASAPQPLKLVPYAEAGSAGDSFSVWLRDRAREDLGPFSLFTQTHESSSRTGTHHGSIADNSAATFTSTDDGSRRDEDWFQINDGWATAYNVIIFRHGRSTPNGGWFDTSKGKPRVLLKSWKEYHEVAVIEDYPATTAESPGPLTDGQAFRIVIPKEKREPAFFIRIAGVPAHGQNPKQNHATCSEIQVFNDPAE